MAFRNFGISEVVESFTIPLVYNSNVYCLFIIKYISKSLVVVDRKSREENIIFLPCMCNIISVTWKILESSVIDIKRFIFYDSESSMRQVEFNQSFLNCTLDERGKNLVKNQLICFDSLLGELFMY